MYGKHEATLLWNTFLLPLYSYLMQFWSPPIHFLRELRRCRLRILRLSPSFTANQLTYLDYLTRLPPAKDPALLAQATLLRFQRTCPVDLDTLAFARRSSRPTFSIDWQWTQARLNWPTHALPWALVQRQLDIFSGRMTIVTPISSSSVPEDTTWRIYYDGSFNPSTGQMGWAVVLTIASLTRLEGYGSVQVDHRGLNYHGAVHRSCFTAEANAPLEFAIFANTASFGAPWLTARSCLWHHTDNKSVLSLLLGRPPKSEFPLSSKLQAWLLILQSHWSLSQSAMHVPSHVGITCNEQAYKLALLGSKLPSGEAHWVSFPGSNADLFSLSFAQRQTSNQTAIDQAEPLRPLQTQTYIYNQLRAATWKRGIPASSFSKRAQKTLGDNFSFQNYQIMLSLGKAPP